MTTHDKNPNPDTDVSNNKKELIIGAIVVVAIIAIVATIATLINNSVSKVIYEPVAACDMFTQEEAKELLGPNAFNSTATAPVLNGDTATSKCGYTDGNSNTEDIIVAAVMVRNGINDAGAEKNAAEFSNNEQGATVEAVDGVGDRAFYNQDLGQLNILDGRDWIILSYGIGSAAPLNTLEDALKLAEKVLN